MFVYGILKLCHYYLLQDTVLGLQALSEFAKRIQSDQAEFTISIRQSDVLQVQFDINSGNSFVYHEFQLPDTNSISVATNGSGCFLLQVSSVVTVYLIVAFFLLLQMVHFSLRFM